MITNIYEDNGHNPKKLKQIINNYDPKMAGKQKNNNNSKSNTNYNNNPAQNQDNEAANLFAELPFGDNIEELPYTDRKPIISLPFVPGLANKLRRICSKASCQVAFKSGPKLQSILCSKNK